MLAALALPRLLRLFSDRAVMLTGGAVCTGGLSATTIFLVVSPAGAAGWIALCTLWTAIGAGASMINTPSARLLRLHSTEGNRSMVFTAQFSLSHAAFLLTYPIAGWVGAALGQVVAALSLAVLATLATLAANAVWRRGRDCHGTTTREAILAAAGQPDP